MKLVYYDSRGLPLAAVVAAIRTGRLPQNGAFKAAALFSLPLINSPRAFVYYGTDEKKRKVYALWCKADPLLIPRFFRAREELGREAGEWFLLPVDGVPGTAALRIAGGLPVPARAGEENSSTGRYSGTTPAFYNLP